MSILFILTLIFAALNAIAVWRGIAWLVYLAKPAVMVCLFAWLYSSTGLQGASFWFGIGILFSLVGDILYLFMDRLFIPGLIAFLLTHLAYILGFGQLINPSPGWGAILALILALGTARLLRRLALGLRARGLKKLILPVQIYGIVITLMLLLALLTLSDLSWNTGAAVMVSAGAFLFYLSDLVLAWNRFVSPIRNGGLLNIGLYQLGQIALIGGIVLQLPN